MTRNVALFNRLIEHYKANPPQNWSYGHCVAGVMRSWGPFDTSESASSISIQAAKRLGITGDQATALIYGGCAEFMGRSDTPLEAKRDHVLETLTKLRDDGVIYQHWGNKEPAKQGALL